MSGQHEQDIVVYGDAVEKFQDLSAGWHRVVENSSIVEAVSVPQTNPIVVGPGDWLVTAAGPTVFEVDHICHVIILSWLGQTFCPVMLYI